MGRRADREMTFSPMAATRRAVPALHSDDGGVPAADRVCRGGGDGRRREGCGRPPKKRQSLKCTIQPSPVGQPGVSTVSTNTKKASSCDTPGLTQCIGASNTDAQCPVLREKRKKNLSYEPPVINN